ncbi:MAG: hypothetical protein LDL56_02335 [Armatimonadetes bacterium]|nr:hypothetical protein [Armatimonadota bacterium]
MMEPTDPSSDNEPKNGGEQPPLWAGAYRPRRTPVLAAVSDILRLVPKVQAEDQAILERIADLLRTVWLAAFPNLGDRLLVEGLEAAASGEELREKARQALRRPRAPKVLVPLYPEERLAILELARHARVLGQYSPAIELYALRILAASLCASTSDRKRLRELSEGNPDA